MFWMFLPALFAGLLCRQVSPATLLAGAAIMQAGARSRSAHFWFICGVEMSAKHSESKLSASLLSIT